MGSLSSRGPALACLLIAMGALPFASLTGACTSESQPTAERACPEGWILCDHGNLCTANEAECPGRGPSEVAKADSGAETGGSRGAPVVQTLTTLAHAERLACASDVLYAATVDRKIFRVPVAAPTPEPLSPDPLGTVGFLTWSNDRLFYTLPTEGEVHLRNLGDARDVRLASGQASPQGIALAANGDDLYFNTTTGISRIASTGENQTPSVSVVFASVASFARGPGFGLTLAGTRFVVTHNMTNPAVGDNAFAVYTAEGDEFMAWGMIDTSIGVTTAKASTYWTSNFNVVNEGPNPLLRASLAPKALATEQSFIGDLCVLGTRIYFTAANRSGEREIRFIELP